MAASSSWAQALAAPIAGPVSDFAQYTDALQLLRQTMAEHTAVHGHVVPWAKVSAQAQALLAQNKDLKVAAYLIVAQTRLDGPAASALGLQALSALCEQQWPLLTPPVSRLRGRLAAIAWLHDELGQLWRAMEPATADAKTSLATAAQHLDATLAALSTIEGPSFARLAQNVPVVRALPSAAAAPPQNNIAAPAKAPSRTDIAPRPDAATVGPGNDVTSLGAWLLSQADAQLAAQPLQGGALRLRRQGLWLHIDQAPPLLGDVTRVPPLSDALHAQLLNLQHHQAWQELLQLSESAMVRHRLVLALQRFSGIALRHLVPANSDLGRGIAAETWALLLRVPALATCKAADGTPLLDEETLAWLNTFKTQHSAVMQPSQRPPRASQAHSAQASGNAAHHEPRQQFLQKLQDAQLAEGAKGAQVAHSALRALTRQSVALRLWQWEPSLAARTWEAEAAALCALPHHPRRSERMSQLVRLMAAIDVSRAQQLNEQVHKQGV